MIRYEFALQNAAGTHCFEVNPERASAPQPTLRPWMALQYKQCANCPLKPAEHETCPVAGDIHDVVERFSPLLSFERAKVTVTLNDRVVTSECDVQTGLSSLLGLIMATSACPVLSRLRPLARIHQPFQTVEETRFRLIGAYGIGLLIEPDKGMDLDGLGRLLDDLTQVNRGFIQRLRGAATNDAIYNSIALLAASAMMVQASLDESLRGLKKLAISAD